MTAGWSINPTLGERWCENTPSRPRERRFDTQASSSLLQVVKPRSNAATSVPGLLSLFHNEWDALMLETATLREALDARNRELATSLYQYDAACRVIARLVKERDEARAGVTVSAQPPAAAVAKRGGEAPPPVPAAKKAKGGIPKATEAALEAHALELSKTRRKRVASPDLASVEQLSAYAVTDTLPLHSSAQPGITGVALHPGREGDIIATSGADTTAVVFSRAAGKKLAELKGHTKEVSSIAFVGSDPLVTGALDSTVRVWRPKKGNDPAAGYSCAAVLQHHGAAVTAIAPHPLGQHCASTCVDGTWAFLDVAAGECLSHVGGDSGSAHAGLNCASFHPDGLLLGTGSSDGVIRLWDVKTGTSPAAMTGHAASSPVSSLSFSENGYHVASAGADGVRVWDLRKQKCILHLEATSSGSDGATCSVCYDYSGFYLAMGTTGGGVSVHATRNELARVASWAPGTSGQASRVAALAWGPHAQFLAVGARGDHNLRVLSAPA